MKELTERQRAMLKIVRVLGNPLFGMSKPQRDEAIALAEEHNFTVREVIEASNEIALGGGLQTSF